MKEASQKRPFFIQMSQKKKIAIQGIKGSFHHQAANHFFGNEIELIECVTFEEVIKSTKNGQCTYGIMAIENSLAGSIIPNYKLTRHSGLKIVGEVGLRVKHNLVALNGAKVEDIKEVRSHQMAIRQCTPFFETHEYIRLVESFDTAGSAKEIADKKLKNIGAIASELAAEVYGLTIIQQGIESHELNYTRFLILSAKDVGIENPNKVSIYIEAKHHTGALAQLLTVVSGLGINLSKIQSHPIPSKNTHYGFFITLDIESVDQLDNLEILLKSMTVEYHILGVYRKGETHG